MAAFSIWKRLRRTDRHLLFICRRRMRNRKHRNRGWPNRIFNFNQQRVLVMDDEAAIRDLTSELLATLGYEVITVPDGVEALRTYEDAMRSGENFQAVILDATIRGGMGGVATIERLRDLDPNVTAIICSGYSDEAALAEFLTYGFCAALPRPFTRHELAHVLERAFEAARAG